MDISRPLFDAQPSEIVFQQFEPPTSYDVILSLRNIDKVTSMHSHTTDHYHLQYKHACCAVCSIGYKWSINRAV